MTELDLDDVARCPAPGCPRPPVLGGICRVHGDDVGRWLAEIRGDLAELEAGEPADRPADDDPNRGRKATKIKNRTTPVDLDAAVLTDRRIAWLTPDDVADLVDVVGRDPLRPALDVLSWWAAIVRDGRGLPYPTRTIAFAGGPPCSARCWHLECAAARAGVGVQAWAPLTVGGERQVLVDNLEWCLRQPWAGQLWRDVRQLWAALKAARGDDAGRPVATCRRPVAGAACGGRIFVDRGAGWCARCSHTWTGREVLELTRRGTAA